MTLHIIPDWHAYSIKLPEFNNTIHQTQLFLSQGQKVVLIIVDYLPNLRQILSQKKIEAADTWSVYDLLQRIRLKTDKPLALTDFSWPQNATFVYMTDCVLVHVGAGHFATVHLQKPNMSRFQSIDLLKNDVKTQELLLDDRGFVSRVTTFNAHGDIIRRDYLTPSGDVAVQEDCVSGVVTTQQTWTSQTTFTNMDELIAVALAYHLQTVPENEFLVVAQSQIATFFMNKLTPKQPVILSYQSDLREKQHNKNQLLAIDNGVDFSVADTPATYEKIIKQTNDESTISVIPPYTVTQQANRSAEQPVVTIYWIAQTINESDFAIVTNLLARYLNVLILIETAQTHEKFDAIVHAASLTAANQHGIIDSDSQMAYETRFQFIPPQGEVQRQRYMSNMRVLLDLNDQPDQFLQAQAIAHSVPQINRVKTDYLIPNENGKLVTHPTELIDALNFYVENPQSLSKVREVTRQLGKAYSEEMIWIKWQQIFNKIKQRKA